MLPTKYEPMHVVTFSNGAVEYVKSAKLEEFLAELNDKRAIMLGKKIYASRLFESCEPVSSKDPLDLYVIGLEREYREKLLDFINKRKQELGKNCAPLTVERATGIVEGWKNEV